MRNGLVLVFLVITGSMFSLNLDKNFAKTTKTLVFTTKTKIQKSNEIPIDSIALTTFFNNYPKLKIYESKVFEVYRKHQFNYIWFQSNKINELGNLLFTNLNQLSEEGLQLKVPYKDELYTFILQTQEGNKLELELLLTSIYFFYADNVYRGLNDKITAELGWFIPKKKQSFVSYLDTLMDHPSLLNKNENKVFKQYYRLKDVLKKYRSIEKQNSWKPIIMTNNGLISLGYSAPTVCQIRERLYMLGYLKIDSKSSKCDNELIQSVRKYKQNMGIKVDDFITTRLIASLNVPISDRIKTLSVNMERCRWISSDFNQAMEYIFINIPSYQMNYIKEGKTILNSKVVVGKVMNQTVVFSGKLQYVVFSPYWNVPKSIIDKEIMPEIKKNKNYLSQHNMEWNDGNIRQKPGPKNSLGLVKFLFPNSNSIYLHDTPSKSLFNEEKRAFSHGCIRLEKPIELAYLLVKDDKNWTMEKLNKAFHSKKEIWYTLKNKIPVYIGYFTSWVDNEGEIHFYEDIYARDECLAAYLFQKE